MIWSKEHLQSLDERTLTTKVLIPLFEAMEYNDVTFYHGGALEQGKDLVMWRSEPLRERVNYAVIVKTERITGSASSAGIVLTQIKQARGAPFIDKKTLQKCRVNHCFVVTSRDILKEGTNSLRSLLSDDGLVDHVTLIDGDELLKLLRKHLPPILAVHKLREGFDLLPKIPEHECRLEVTEKGIAVKIAPESESSKLLEINLKPIFKDTPEGKEKLKEFEAFLNTGMPVEFDEKSLESIELPEFIRHLVPVDLKTIQVQLGPSKNNRSTVVALEFVAPDGDTFILPYIDFSSIQGGQEEMTMSNVKQSIPFHITLTLSKEFLEGTFSYSVKLIGEGIHWMAQLLDFERVLAKGPAVYLRNQKTGIQYRSFNLPPGTIRLRGDGFADLVKRVVHIQDVTRIPVAIPDRVFFSDADCENIKICENIIEKGCYPDECSISEISFTLSANGIRERGATFLKEPLGDITFVTPPQNQKVLDTEICLGALKVNCVSPQLIEEDRVLVERIVKGESDVQEAKLRLTSREGGRFEAKFLDWPPVSADDN